MASMEAFLPQSLYRDYRDQTAQWVANEFKKALAQNDLKKLNELKSNPGLPGMGAEPAEFARTDGARRAFSKALLKQMISARKEGRLEMSKAGVNSSLGYNFYDLRGPSFLEYPVNVPFRNSLQRVGRVNDGYGTAAHWKATRNPGYLYGGVPEGGRAQQSTPDENDYTATYKEIGDEAAVTFTAEFAGEGYTDNLADEHLRGLHRLWLKEEAMILHGNGGTGTGNNGFKLGTAPTPVVSTMANSSSTLPTGTNVSVAVVCLTAMGNPTNAQYGYVGIPTVSGGLTPSYTYQAPGTGETVTVNGGTSAISAMSAVVVTTASKGAVTASIPAASLPIKGCYGYAWYVNITDAANPSLSNAFLCAVTNNPSVTILAAPTGTQSGAAAGLNADHSFENKDFDGLLTYSASTAGAYYRDLQGASLTSTKDGRVLEIEAVLESIFQQFQAGVDSIWGSVDAIVALDAAIRYSGTQSSAFRFNYVRDAQNNILGGYVVSGYQSRYAVNNPMGANVIPIRIHPMIPAGTLYFDVSTNPYPHSRMPFVRGLLVQRDYYSIEWPLVSRQWTFGTYVHEALQHNLPWVSAVLTGIGSFAQSN